MRLVTASAVDFL